jgi:galactosyl transferase GMA12/MNN10 family
MEVIEVNKSPDCLVTFGSGKTWRPAVQRLKKQAIECKRFGKIFLYDDNDLQFNLTGIENNFFNSNPRGFGMWIWKPLIIKDLISKYPDCDLIVYLDSGCEINSTKKALEKLDSYLDTARKYGGIAFEIPFIEQDWTSKFVLEDMNAKQLALTQQLAGGMFFLKNSNSNHQFLDSWINWMKKDNFKYLKGNEVSPSDNNYQEHRFDQSIFSILWKLNEFVILPDQSYWEPNWRTKGGNFPIWSTRNRLRFSVASNRFFLLSYRALRVFAKVFCGGKIII